LFHVRAGFPCASARIRLGTLYIAKESLPL
jgi:hypothetical protein